MFDLILNFFCLLRVQQKKSISVLLIICSCFCCSELYSQKILANTPGGVYEVRVTNTGCTAKEILLQCNRYSPHSLFAIALYKDILYFVTEDNQSLYRTTLGHTEVCELLSPFDVVTSLTVDQNGILYAAIGYSLLRYNPYTGEKIYLGDMPFYSSGDMLFYKDELYMASTFAIIQVNIDTPSLSKKYIDLSQPEVYGMASVSGGCSENKVFALANIGTSTQMIELDMENRKEIGVACTLPGNYYDAASITEAGENVGILIDTIVKRNICIGSTTPSAIKVVASGVYGRTLKYKLDNSPDNTTGIFENLDEGIHKIHISINDTCFKDTSVLIEKGYCNVYMPTAFTPNNDGLNDVLRPAGLTANGEGLFVVYNRWGKKIFETKKIAQGWNGKINDVDQPPGTYVWMLHYTDSEGKKQFLKGTAVLMR